MKWFSVLLAGSVAAVAGAEGPSASQGVETLPTGVKVAWTRHFDRNALRGGCIAGDAFIALTESGVLLRFDMGTFKLSGERAVDGRVTAFADVSGIGPMVALDNGDVYRVDPKTLTLKLKARFPRHPMWIGGRPTPDGKTSVVAVNGSMATGRRSMVCVLETLPPESAPSAIMLRSRGAYPHYTANRFHLDRRGRIWLGGDFGEWGGWWTAVDLDSGRETPAEIGPNVRGFLEWPDSEVWTYGGLEHLGPPTTFIVGHRGNTRFEHPDKSFPDRKNEADLPPRRPRDIIQRMVVEAGGKTAMVFTEADWFRVDREMKNWKHLGRLPVDRPNRRFKGMGFDFVSVLALPAPGWVLAATADDGLLEFSDGKVVSHAVADQFPGHVDRIVNTNAGDVLEHTWYSYRGWVRTGGKWAELPEREWDCGSFGPFATPDGTVWSVGFADGAALGGGMRAGGLRAGVLGIGLGPVPREFQLKRRTDKGWVDAGTSDCFDVQSAVAVTSVGKGWLLRAGEKLLRLMLQADGRMSLTTLALPTGDVFDAFELAPGRVMLATEFGLKTFDAATGKLGETAMANFADSIRRITRDGRGRMWFAGKFLWMVDAEGRAHRVDLPAFAGHRFTALGRQGSDAAGIIVSLGSGGAVYLQTVP